MVTADVLRSILVSAVEEAEARLGTTAYSSSVVEAQDFAAAIYGADTGLIAQSRRASGTFTGTLGRPANVTVPTRLDTAGFWALMLDAMRSVSAASA